MGNFLFSADYSNIYHHLDFSHIQRKNPFCNGKVFLSFHTLSSSDNSQCNCKVPTKRYSPYMVYTMLSLRHSVLIVVRQKYLVAFFRYVVFNETSLALAWPFDGFCDHFTMKKKYKESRLAHD